MMTERLPLLARLLALFILPAAVATATDDEAPPTRRETTIESWLTVGPFDLQPAAFSESSRDLKAALRTLRETHVDVARLRPAVDAKVALPTGGEQAWGEDQVVTFASSQGLRLAYAATSLSTPRWVECELTIRSFQTLRVFVDGVEVATKKVVEDHGASEHGAATATLKLEPGTHRVLVKTVFTPDGPEHWDIFGAVSVAADSPADPPRPHIEPTRPLAVDDLLDTESPAWVSLSDNGLWLAIGKRAPEVPADHQVRWIEIRDADSGAVVQTTEGSGDLGRFQWRPMSDSYCFVTGNGDGGSVWLRSLDGGPARELLTDVKGLGEIRWTPDGETLVFSVTEESKREDRGVKRMRELNDRWPGERDPSHLHQIDVDGGLRRRLTTGELGVSLEDIRPDGRALLFTRTRHGGAARPYRVTDLWELDLETLHAQPITEHGFLNGALYAPDGRVVVRAGRSFAADPSRATEGPPNDYEEQLFLRTGRSEWRCLTEEFPPAVTAVAADHASGGLFVAAEDGARRRAYRFDLGSFEITALPIDVDVLASIAPSRLAPRLAWTGSSVTSPPTVGVLDVETGERARTIERPGDDTWSTIRFGEVRTWAYRNANKDVIDGRVYLPPDFDPQRKYPVIVYYYGGTSPIDRSFGGRYPKNLWAAHGYVVYTMNPSGATGYGPAWSDRHVNDWGKRSGAEVIEATRAFLDTHPFADAERVGCIGASYGGFMTMLLLTRTDLFATGISHAGISSIASYWGEGFWGYAYSAVATAESFPWNRRDIYVDQSPLFAADKITAPLLLLHGAADTNVPIGESEAMYTALKTLGKEVEFIRIDGENHHILTYPKRKLWMKTILAWFDWKLKGEREWWDALYEADDTDAGDEG